MTYLIESYIRDVQPENSRSDRLLMEATLISGGIAQGIKTRAAEFVSNPVENFYETAKTVAATGAIGYLSQRYMSRLAAPLLGAVALADSIPVLKTTKEAMSETWSDPSTYAQNKNKVADGLGKKVFDLALYSSAALGGIARGKHEQNIENLRWAPQEELATLKSQKTHFPWLQHDPTAYQSDYMTIKQVPFDKGERLGSLYRDNVDSVVWLHGTSPQGMSLHTGGGTGFFVEEKLIVTNHHVMRGAMLNIPKAKLNSGEIVDVKLVAHDKAADLALLEVVSPGSAKAVTLGDPDSLVPGISLYVVGHHYGVSRALGSSGSYLNSVQSKYLHTVHGVADQNPHHGLLSRRGSFEGRTGVFTADPRPQGGNMIRQSVLRSDFPGYFGGSGSPVFNASGDVVGVYSLKEATRSGATTVDHVRALIAAYKEHKPDRGWLNVITHADPVSPSLVSVLRVRNFTPRRNS